MTCYLELLDRFLVHLSQRLKCTIVIMRCPSSVRPSSVAEGSSALLCVVRRRSSVHPTIRRLSSLTFHIFDFSSKTAEQNSMKLDRKQEINVLYQVCVFSGRSEKQDGRPGLWLAETFSTSPLKPLNGTQRNLTGSIISQRPLPSLCFSGHSEKQDDRPGLWLPETSSPSPLKQLNRIQQNLIESEISTSST